MCKIITILNKNKDNTEVLNKFISANIAPLCSERSGYSVFRDTDTFDFIGDNAYKNAHINMEYKGEQVFIIHTRTATAGAMDIEGLHLKKLDNRYIFAHNGTVSSFANVERYNDSYYFFKRVIKSAINPKNIVHAIQKYGFHGKGFLYDTDKRIMYYFCNMFSYIHALPDCLIITSWEANIEITQYKSHNILGYTWYETLGKERLPILKTEKIDDIYMKFKDLYLVEEESIAKSTSSYYDDDEEDTTPTYNPYGIQTTIYQGWKGNKTIKPLT